MSALVFLFNESTGKPISIQDDTAGRPEGGPLAEANYQIPILWLALFTEANITTVLIRYDRDANGQWLRRPEPTLFTSRQDGLATYIRRKDAIRNKLGAAHARYVDDWERMLASELAQGTHFQIEFSEIYYMYHPGEFEPVLLSYLKGIDELTGPGWQALCDQANLGNPTAKAELGIRGWTGHEALGWGD